MVRLDAGAVRLTDIKAFARQTNIFLPAAQQQHKGANQCQFYLVQRHADAPITARPGCLATAART